MIRLAEARDFDEILRIYDAARAFMRRSGNLKQWADGYPQPPLLKSDMKKKQLYVWEEDGVVHGVFAFILGEDPTYAYIEDGQWLNSLPYGTIHRIGSDGKAHGLLREALSFALTKTNQVRADTHRDNAPMQHVLAKNGFVRCGIIYLENGDPRIAYHYAKEA